MSAKNSSSTLVVRPEKHDTLHALDEIADELDDIAAEARLGRWLRQSDARVAAVAARHIRAIPGALTAAMNEAFAVGRDCGHREAELGRAEA